MDPMKTLIAGLVAAFVVGCLIIAMVGLLPRSHESLYDQIQWQQRH